ncbi:MAG: ATP-binding protein, partial [Sedimenticola sp.]
NAFKSSFIANISHELRTPLNAIIGMSHILDEEDLQSKQRSHVKTINDAGRQLDGMINQMLDFSRVDTGSLEVHLLPLMLGRLVQECVDLVKEKARQKSLSLAVHCPEDAGQWMLGDAQRIWEILLHILDNAIKFTESGGVEVIVGVEPKGDTHYEVAITVEDSGIGMDRYLGRQAQHDFIQAEDYRTRKQGGLGLALTMSRRLLELMGGSLDIESEVGRGTKVTIHLLLECANEELVVTGSPAVAAEAEKISDAVVEPGKEEKVEPFALSEFQRQQLDEELSELMVLVDSDYTHAVEKLDAMLIHYQGSDYHVDLVTASEKMAGFDSDGVRAICQSVQENISQRNR